MLELPCCRRGDHKVGRTTKALWRRDAGGDETIVQYHTATSRPRVAQHKVYADAKFSVTWRVLLRP